MKQLEAAAAWWGRWRLFVLCIAVPRMLSPNFGHRLSTQFSVEVLHASRTNLGMLDSVRHWVGLVSNPLGGYLARTRGIKWLIVLHTGWLICSNLWTANSYTWQTLMYARALSGLQESFDEIALGYFFITQLAPEQRAWGAVALAFVLRLHATIGPLLGAAILSQLENPEDPENYRTVLWIEAACRLVPLGFVCCFVPSGLGVVPAAAAAQLVAEEQAEEGGANAWLEARGRSRCRRCAGSSWGRTFRHSWRSLGMVACWSSIIFFVTKCWSSYAVPLRATELGISKMTLQFSQSVEEAVAIPTQLVFGWALTHSAWGLKTVGLLNGVLWGASLLLVGFWVGEGDDSGFYWAHGLYGVGYGGYIVNDVVKATLAPAPDAGAADWLAMLHTIKDVVNIGVPPLMGYIADTSSVSRLSAMCAVMGVLAGVFFFCWVPKGRIDGSALGGGGDGRRRPRRSLALPQRHQQQAGSKRSGDSSSRYVRNEERTSIYGQLGSDDEEESGGDRAALLGHQPNGDARGHASNGRRGSHESGGRGGVDTDTGEEGLRAPEPSAARQ